jgi:ribosomal protein S18 acetylase RimI-like enzyme
VGLVDANRDIELRKAVAEDAGAIVALIRSSFAPGLLETTIYGCEGIEDYVRALIEAEPRAADTRYTVAVADGALAGVVEMRQLRDRLFCNYIAVARGARSRGVGIALLGAGIAAARRPGQLTLELDVFDDNERALAWYRGLGFGESSRVEWRVLAPPGGDRASAAPVSGWAQALACQRAFGFSEVSIQGAEGGYSVGLMGREWFRLTDPGALEDPALGATLHALDPHRSLLALVPPETLSEPVAELRATTVRLWAGLDAVARRIAERAR